MAAEPELTNQKKVVPPVEEKTPTAEIKEPSIKDIIAGIDPGKVKMAEKMGVPLGQLITYMAYQEKKLNFVIENMPKKEDMAGAFKQGIENLQKEQMEAYQQSAGQGGQPQGQGGLAQQLLPLLLKTATGGGGQDEEIAALTKEMFRMNIEGMKADIGFTKALKGAMLGKYATGLVKEIVP